MSTKHKNPYKRGNYYDLFGFMKKKQVVTRNEVLQHAAGELKMATSAAQAITTVMLSPRKESKRGDCRGNYSSMGHLYYMEKLPRRTVKGVKESQRFRLRWRTPALEPNKRPTKERVEAKKVAVEKDAKPVKTKAKQSKKTTA